MPRVFVYPTTPGSTAKMTALSLVSMRDRSRLSIADGQPGLNLPAEAAGDPELEPESQPQVNAFKSLNKGEDASAIVQSSPCLTENESVETVDGLKVDNAEDSTGKEESGGSSIKDCAGLRRDGDNDRSSLSSHQDGEIRTEPQAETFRPSTQQNDLSKAASSTTHQVEGEHNKGTKIGILTEIIESRETNQSIESEQGICRLDPGRNGKGDARLCDQGELKEQTLLEASNPAGKDDVDPSEDVPAMPPTKRAKCGENAAKRDEIGDGNIQNTCDRHYRGDHSPPRRVNGDRSTAAADGKSGPESHGGHSLPSPEIDSAQDGEEGMATHASSPFVGGLKVSTFGCHSGASVGSPASTSKLNPAAVSNAPQSVRSACDEIVAEVMSDRTEREQAHEVRVPPMVQEVTRSGHGGTEAGDDESTEGTQSDEEETELTQTESTDCGGEETEANRVSTSLSSISGDACDVSASMKPAPKGRSVSGRDWKVRKQSQRASMQVTTATDTLSSTWARKLEIKAKRKAAIAMEQEMKERKRREIEDKKQERLERERRRQRNEMKNTTYQTISKTHKLKTMSKKQLRQIKKRQVNPRTGEVEFVSPWGGGNKK